MIIIVILIALITMIWVQYPQIKKTYEDNTIPLYLRIFNIVKLPLLVICFIAILYSFETTQEKSIDNLDVYMSIPKY